MNSPREIRLLAPAKLNLVLEVTGRRADGFHEIDSLFVPVDVCDDVSVKTGAGEPGEITIRCDDPSCPLDARNTAWRAVEEFYGPRAERPSIEIAIRKRIPAGAGLGGGSSDAATVLRALARLGGVDERPERLLETAARVGADVPFFLWCRPARVRGIGEIVEPLPSFPPRTFAIVWPGFAVSTAWAYAALDRALTSPKPADTMRRFLSGQQDLAEIHNDFEPVVGSTHPELWQWKKRLLSLGADNAGLSGSGSAVFGVFREPSAAENAAATIAADGFWAVSARILEGPPAYR